MQMGHTWDVETGKTQLRRALLQAVLDMDSYAEGETINVAWVSQIRAIGDEAARQQERHGL